MKKLVFLFIVAIFVFSFSPFVLFADGPGSSLDDPFIVSNINDLQTALSGADYDYIYLDTQIDDRSNPANITIPSNKTLIIGDSDFFPYLLSHASVFVEEDATLIIQSGVSLGQGHVIESDGGTIINRGLIVNTVIGLGSSNCTFINESSGIVNDRNAILFDSDATIQNDGQIDCYLYYYGSRPNIDGIAADRIGSMLFLDDDLSTIPFIDATGDADFPIIIEDSIGLPYDGSFVDVLISERDEPRFMRLYHITLESDQTLSLQRSGNFSPAMYIAEGHPDSTATNIRFVGQHFTAESAINGNDDSQVSYYVFVAGYNAYDTGHFTLSIHQPSQTEPLSFFDPSAPVSGPGWSWDGDTHTLTLDGFTFSGSPDVTQTAILLPANSHIVLADGSNNYIRSDSAAIYGIDNLTISGQGSLTINTQSSGIQSENDLTIDNITSLRIDAGIHGIYTGQELVISDCDELFVNAGDNISNSQGISSRGSISILRSNLWVTGNRHGIVSTGLTSETASIYIDESFINATTVEQYGRGPITIEGEGDIVLDQCLLVYPEEAQVMNYYDSQGDRLGQTFFIFERPDDPGIIYDMQHAIRSLQISPAYTLNYDANGGAGDGESLSGFYAHGDTVTVADDAFSYDSFVFTGWNTSADGMGDEYEPSGTISITANTTLFAQWRAEYNVQFVDWDGTVLSEQKILSGDPALEPTAPSREGYVFVGWDQSIDSVTDNIVITAVYNAEIIEEETDAESAINPEETEEETDSDTDTDTDAESSTSMARTGQSERSTRAAVVCIAFSIVLLTSYIILRKNFRLEMQ